jgi:hypothetical protein
MEVFSEQAVRASACRPAVVLAAFAWCVSRPAVGRGTAIGSKRFRSDDCLARMTAHRYRLARSSL